jgi:hypothetical protein
MQDTNYKNQCNKERTHVALKSLGPVHGEEEDDVLAGIECIGEKVSGLFLGHPDALADC